MGRRVLVVAAIAVVIAVAAVIVVRAVGGEDAPPDTAARLVPATALAYVHLSTDPEREADRRLLATLGGFPSVAAGAERLAGVVGGGFDLERDVRPWLGDEAAFALLDTGQTRAGSLLLLSVRDRAAADAFLERASGSRGTTTYRGVPIERFESVSVGFAGGFMAIGQDASVRAAIDRQQGSGASLAASVPYREVTAQRPPDRSLSLVIPATGVERVLAPATGLLGALGGLLSDPELLAVGASLSATDQGLAVTVRQARGEGTGGSFEPTLLEEVPRAAAAYLGAHGLDAFAALVPSELRSQLGRRLSRALAGASLDVERDLLGPLAGEVALSVTPGLPVPTVTLVARTSDEQRTREVLARLQVPLAELLAPPAASGGPAGAFEQRELGEVSAFVLPIAPGVELTYAVDAGRLIVSSQANGVGHVLAERASIVESPDFERALGDLPESAEAVVFLDLGQLLALAELAGSTGDPAFQALQDDLRRVRVAGAVVQREGTDSTAELFFEIP